jgi:hypothetical protein
VSSNSSIHFELRKVIDARIFARLQIDHLEKLIVFLFLQPTKKSGAKKKLVARTPFGAVWCSKLMFALNIALFNTTGIGSQFARETRFLSIPVASLTGQLLLPTTPMNASSVPSSEGN